MTRISHVSPLAAGWDDLRVSLNTARAAANAPDLAVFRGGVQCWAFSASALDEVFFDVQLPHNWVLGTDIEPHVHWSVGANVGNGTTDKVRWQLEYTWANYDAAFPAPTTMTAVDTLASTEAYDHQITDLGSISGTGKKVSSVLMCRLARVGTATEDTFAQVAYGLSVDFHIQVQGNGGLTETAGAV